MWCEFTGRLLHVNVKKWQKVKSVKSRLWQAVGVELLEITIEYWVELLQNWLVLSEHCILVATKFLAFVSLI